MKQEANSRRVMLFYESFEEAINDVYKSNKAASADLYSAVIRFGLYGEEPQLTGIAATLWKLMLPNLESARNKAEAGRKGGKASKRNNPNGRRGKASAKTATEAPDGSPMDEEEAAPKPQRKAPPTLDNIRAAIEAHSLNVDAEDFYNYYASRNWEIDGRKIGNITALLRKWDKGGEWQKEYHEMRFLTGETECPPHLAPNECGEVNACGITVKLGYGERIDAAGRRTYGSGRVTVPEDAPRRPADGYEWSEPRHEWIYNCI